MKVLHITGSGVYCNRRAKIAVSSDTFHAFKKLVMADGYKWCAACWNKHIMLQEMFG